MKNTQCFFLIAILSASACRVHDVGSPLSESMTLEETFTETSGGSTLPDEWWQIYEDPTLNRLVTESLSGNTRLSQAWVRLAQAGALADQANAAAMPTVSADAGISRSRNPSPFGSNQEGNQFSAGVSVGYEVDLWGRVKDLQDAALLDTLATRLDIDSLALSLVAQVTEAYFDVLEQGRQLTLLEEQIQVSKEYLQLVEFRFGQGDAAALDVFQQRQSVAGLESRMPAAKTAKSLANNRLAVLLGRTPGRPMVSEVKALPATPALPASGVPADLLIRRPDLRAAELRVMASDHRVGAAIANKLPGLRIGANVGTQAPEVEDLVTDFVWSIFTSIGATIWDGGRLEAEVERSKAVVKEKVEGYKTTLLQCVQEVEDALSRNRYHTEYVLSLQYRQELAEATLQEARSRYINGLSSYLPVLQALQALQEVERSVVTAHRRELANRNALYKALGGTWSSRMNNPQRPPEEELENSES